eukprot:TRINITY_DN33690_c0_g1_i1.p1 TRINITY_DN33690_c0_g1~~TRINITY_DN33690_c0_g1_i1.p1  ORF type:complete len:582 (+),score=132.42 TRINITY_DN33690_c0_g1_i1:41-1786(+)
MGNKVCKTLSGRESTVAEDGAPVPKPRIVRSQSALPMQERESLEWLNEIIAAVWPKVNEAVQKKVREEVTPQIQAKMPTGLKGTHFKKFSLGAVTPQLGPIEIIRNDKEVKLIVGVNYQSDVDIEISTTFASIGVKAIHLKGDLMIRFEPLLSELPVVGGLCAYFIDAPDVNLDFTGLGNVADCPGIAGLIRGVIDSSIASACVLPNTIPVPVGTPEQGVDPALLAMPKPIGVLRIRAKRGIALAARDISLLKKATSDPFVKVRVADDQWQSSVVKANLNPEWGEHDQHDFVVFDRDQKVWIDVWDEDYIGGSDEIGKAETCRVGEILAISGQPLPLKDSKGLDAGSVELDFEWLEVLPEQDKSADFCMVQVKVEGIVLPPGMGEAALTPAIQGTLGQVMKVTKAGAQPAKTKASDAVSVALQDVAKRCKARGLDATAIAEIVGVEQKEVPSMLGECSKETKAKVAAATSKTAKVNIDIDSVLYFPLARERLQQEEVALCLLGKKNKELASACVSLADVLAADGFIKPGPVKLSLAESSSGEYVAADIEVSVHSLRAVTAPMSALSGADESIGAASTAQAQ